MVNKNNLLKVSGKSEPKKVAGAIVATVKEHGKAYVQAIGAGANNQTIKAVAIARGMISPNGYDLVDIPAFVEVEIDAPSGKGDTRTAIRHKVFPM